MSSPPEARPNQVQELHDRCAELSASLDRTAEAQQELSAPSQAVRTQTLPALELWRSNLRAAVTPEHWPSYLRQINDTKAAARRLGRTHPRVRWLRSQLRQILFVRAITLLLRFLPAILLLIGLILVYIYRVQIWDFLANLFAPLSG